LCHSNLNMLRLLSLQAIAYSSFKGELLFSLQDVAWHFQRCISADCEVNYGHPSPIRTLPRSIHDGCFKPGRTMETRRAVEDYNIAATGRRNRESA
jgi:hypothetical protein